MTEARRKVLTKLCRQQIQILTWLYERRHPIRNENLVDENDNPLIITNEQRDEVTWALIDELEEVIKAPDNYYLVMGRSTCELIINLAYDRMMKRGLDNAPVTIGIYLELHKQIRLIEKGVPVNHSLN